MAEELAGPTEEAQEDMATESRKWRRSAFAFGLLGSAVDGLLVIAAVSIAFTSISKEVFYPSLTALFPWERNQNQLANCLYGAAMSTTLVLVLVSTLLSLVVIAQRVKHRKHTGPGYRKPVILAFISAALFGLVPLLENVFGLYSGVRSDLAVALFFGCVAFTLRSVKSRRFSLRWVKPVLLGAACAVLIAPLGVLPKAEAQYWYLNHEDQFGAILTNSYAVGGVETFGSETIAHDQVCKNFTLAAAGLLEYPEAPPEFSEQVIAFSGKIETLAKQCPPASEMQGPLSQILKDQGASLDEVILPKWHIPFTNQ